MVTRTLKVVSAVSLLALCACSSSDGDNNLFGGGGDSSGGTTSGGTGGESVGGGGTGGDSVGGDGTGGDSTGGGGEGGDSVGGTSGEGGSSGDSAGGDGGTGGDGGDPILQEKRSAGCGMDPGQTGTDWVMYTMATSGTKTRDHAPHVAGDWQFNRQYFIKLPADYDNNTAYPVIWQGPGCGGNGTSVYAFSDPDHPPPAAIRVGVTPPPGNVWNGCFDDKMGDESVEWPMYEQVFDWVSSKFCVDEHREFATGNSSGSWWGNELACIYGSDPDHPIRGIAVNTGGLPVGIESPTCSGGKFAGIWMHDAEDNTNPFAGTQTAITRALGVNGCTGDFNGPRAAYPVPGQPNICEQFTGCPAEYPIVLCTQHGTNHAGNDGIANVAFPQFMLAL